MTYSATELDAPATAQDLSARPWWHALGVFDLETTGIDVETARIVTAHVGLIDMTGRSIVEGAWLADPGVPIPEQASAVHGISTERAQAEGRPAGEVVAEIVLAIEAVFARGIPLVIYNAPYDLTLLDREAKRHGIASPVSSLEHEGGKPSIGVTMPIAVVIDVDTVDGRGAGGFFHLERG